MLKILPKPKNKPYLKPSLFWRIRQDLPHWLSVLLTITALLVPLLIWSWISALKLVPVIFLPPPIAVLQAGVKMFVAENFWFDILASSGRVAVGFLAAAVVGIPMGIAMGTFPSMEKLLSPLIGPIRYMPIAAFIPLIILWAGLGEFAKILIIFLGIVFYNAMMIADAVKFIPSELLNVAYTLGANRRDVLIRVILPAIVPSILDTLRVNIAGAWNFLVISELIAAESGLGFKIVQAQRFLQTDKVLFAIALIGGIGLLIDSSFKALAKAIAPWADQ